MNIKSNTESKLQYKFLFIISTAYLAVDINIQGFLALMPFVRGEFNITRAQAGLYSTFYFLFATMIAIYSGRIVDKIGSKKGLIFGTISVGILIILHSLAPFFSVILILALFTGLVFSIITPSLNKAVMKKVSPENRATSMGIMQIGGGIGGFLGASFLPLLGEIMGWRTAILFSGSLAIAVGLFISRYFKEDSNKNKSIHNLENKYTFKESLIKLLKNKYLLLVCSLGFALGTSIGSVPAHYTIYLTQDINLSRTIAGFSLGILQIGGIVGRPAWGWISDNILKGNRNKGLILVGLSLSIITIFYSFYITGFNSSLYLIYISSFILGIIALGWMGLFFTVVAELVSEEFTGIGTGLALVFTRSGVVISPPIFGYLADVSGSYQLSWLVAGLVVLIFTVFFILISRNMKISK
ncbi:MAG: MFS transporter [Bacillota bacterium]